MGLRPKQAAIGPKGPLFQVGCLQVEEVDTSGPYLRNRAKGRYGPQVEEVDTTYLRGIEPQLIKLEFIIYLPKLKVI